MAAALEDVYRGHVAQVWRYVRARLPSDQDAEDVTQDVFIRAARSWARFDPARGSERAWLTGIARHAVADWWRGRGPETTHEEVPGATDEDDPEARALRAAGSDELRRHLGRLTPREREAVALRFGAELSSREVGVELGISDAGARMLVHRAVEKLREALEDG